MSGLLPLLPQPPNGRTGWPWTEETPAETYNSPHGGWPRITIVCPSFNQGRFIEETIRSVLLQNYPRLEFIIMDGGSTDETAGILERYSPWIAHWESKRDRGQSDALNRGFSRAADQDGIFGWINSDDFYLPGAFARVAAACAADGRKRLLLYGHHVHLHETTGRREEISVPDVFAFEIYAGGFSLPSHATFWTSAAHLPLDEELQFIMDADLFKRMTAAGARVVRVDAKLGVFRLHEAAKTANLQPRGKDETTRWLQQHTRWHWWFYWQLHRVLSRLRRK